MPLSSKGRRGPPTDPRHWCTVATERGQAAFANVIAEDDDLVIAAITVAELRTGVELATEPQLAARLEFLRKVLETLSVERYDLGTAEAHGRLLAHVHRGGIKPGSTDGLGG